MITDTLIQPLLGCRGFDPVEDTERPASITLMLILAWGCRGFDPGEEILKGNLARVRRASTGACCRGFDPVEDTESACWASLQMNFLATFTQRLLGR